MMDQSMLEAVIVVRDHKVRQMDSSLREAAVSLHEKLARHQEPVAR